MNIYSGNSRLWLANRFHLTIILPCRSYFCTAVFLEKKRTNERDEADSFTEKERERESIVTIYSFSRIPMGFVNQLADFHRFSTLTRFEAKERSKSNYIPSSFIDSSVNLIGKPIPNKETFDQRYCFFLFSTIEWNGKERNKLRNVKWISTNCLTRR